MWTVWEVDEGDDPMTRDFQRSKVYAAEGDVWVHEPDWESVKEVQAFVNRITKSVWWKKRSGWRHERLRKVVVTDGRGSARARAFWSYRQGGCVIALPKWSRSQWTVCHELAHHLTPWVFDEPVHGAVFADHYLAMVRKWIGPDAASDLELAFVQRRVSHRPD